MRTTHSAGGDRLCPLGVPASPRDQTNLSRGGSDEDYCAIRFERIPDGRGGFVSQKLGESCGIDQASNDRVIGIE